MLFRDLSYQKRMKLDVNVYIIAAAHNTTSFNLYLP